MYDLKLGGKVIRGALRNRERRHGGCAAIVLYIAVALIASTRPIACGAGVLTWTSVKSAVRTKYPTVEHLTTLELSTWMQSDSTPVPILLDARDPEEYDVSHVHGAVLAPKLTAAIEALAGVEKDHPIVVYCSVGYRSSALAEKLQKKGYTNVFNLEGSIFKWANEDRPVFAGGVRVYQVHPYNHRWGTLLDRRFWPESFE